MIVRQIDEVANYTDGQHFQSKQQSHGQCFGSGDADKQKVEDKNGLKKSHIAQ